MPDPTPAPPASPVLGEEASAEIAAIIATADDVSDMLDEIAALVTAAEQRGAEKAARAVERTAAQHRLGEIPRPKVPGGVGADFLGDWEWAAKVAREAAQ